MYTPVGVDVPYTPAHEARVSIKPKLNMKDGSFRIKNCNNLDGLDRYLEIQKLQPKKFHRNQNAV